MEIAFETPARGFGVTFSARLCDNPESHVQKLIELQEELWSSLNREGFDCIDSESKLSDILKSKEFQFIYRYPKQTIHFSIINFIKGPVESDFDLTRTDIESQSWFNAFRTYIHEEVAPRLSLPLQLQIYKLYTRAGNISGSITVNARPIDGSIHRTLREISSTAETGLREIGVPEHFLQKDGKSSIEVKLRDDGLGINILRFLSDQSKTIEAPVEFAAKFLEYNQQLQNNPIQVEVMQTALVFSDPYLSNRDPLIRLH